MAPAYIKEDLRDLEGALGHFIFDNLATATYKVPDQASILRRVMDHATSSSAGGVAAAAGRDSGGEVRGGGGVRGGRGRGGGD